MNRCIRLHSPFVRRWCTALLASVAALAPLAHAQEAVRPFPVAAKRAIMQVTQPPELLLNGQPERLSPGARIRSPNNLFTLSGSLVGQSLVVNYLRDPQGLVHEVWILNATEAQEAREGATLPPNYVSDGSTSTGEVGAAADAAAARTPQ